MITKSDLKIIHEALIFLSENVSYEKASPEFIAKIHYEYMKADPESQIGPHLKKNEVSDRYDLTETNRKMFSNLKKQLDECGYVETLSVYRGIKLDNTAAKIQVIKEGQMDSKEYAEIVEMLALADIYLMILKSPEDMFMLGEFI